MSGWNYRLVDHGSHLAIHEVYYRNDGSIDGITSFPRKIVGDTVDDIEEDLRLILADLRRLPPLEGLNLMTEDDALAALEQSASAMSAAGQDAEERLEAKPASAAPKEDAR